VTTALVVACSENSTPGEDRVGQSLGAAVQSGLARAQTWRQPWRCAGSELLVGSEREWRLGDHTWRAQGRTLSRIGASRVRLAFVADAGGYNSRPRLASLHRLLGEDAIDAVFSLGGMGVSEEEIQRHLQALADPRWPVIALAGDREGAVAHRGAVESLARQGLAIFDASTIRWVTIGEIQVVTLPGLPSAERLAFGDEGCGHVDEDVGTALAQWPDPAGRLRLSASYRVPALGGESDLGLASVHAGDPVLGERLRRAEVDLAVHASLDGAASRSGHTRADDETIGVSAGHLAAAPRMSAAGPVQPSALVVTISRDALDWSRLEIAEVAAPRSH
jgi:hypothetical protein